MFVSIIAYIIDGIIIGHFLGTEAIAAFGFTVPYQKFTAIFPNIIAPGMQVLCSKNLGKGDLRESNKIFSLALTFARCFFQRHSNFIGGRSRLSCLCRSGKLFGAVGKYSLIISLTVTAGIFLATPIIAELYTRNDVTAYLTTP